MLEEMQRTRTIVTLALEARAKANIKVRQPLQTLKVKAVDLKAEFHPLILDEVNVKELVFDTSLSGEVVLDIELTDELRGEGEMRDLMRHIQDMRKQNGLAPQDTIRLQIDTDEGGQAIIKRFEKEMCKIGRAHV